MLNLVVNMLNSQRYSNVNFLKNECSLVRRLSDFGPIEIDEDWDEFLSKSGVFFHENWGKPFLHNETVSEFIQLKLLGTGTYGNVILIKNTKNDEYFAMKSMEKDKIIKSRQLEHVKNEKMILQSLNFPFTVYLMYFFQDNSFIYLVMPFIPGGELFTYLRKVKKIDEVQARFYASQVILALEYLHFLDLVYRDLKPENILIDQTGYLKLTDFGFCKHLVKPRTYTLCGTPEYLAPEVILNKGYSKTVDWWATGILIYELVNGYPPFVASDTMKLYEKVIYLKYKMPSFFSTELKDLVKNLLQVNLSKRFGNMKNGVNDIKDHRWFRTTNWMATLSRKALVKYQPMVARPGDTKHFDTVNWIPPKIAIEDKYGDKFENF